jgi:hypothetical protein
MGDHGWPVDTRATVLQTVATHLPVQATSISVSSAPATKSLAPPMEDFPALSPKTSRKLAPTLDHGSWSGVVSEIVQQESKTHLPAFKPTIQHALEIKESAVLVKEFVPAHHRSPPPAPLLTYASELKKHARDHAEVSPEKPLGNTIPVKRTGSFPPPWAHIDKIPDWSEQMSPMFTPGEESPRSEWGT